MVYKEQGLGKHGKNLPEYLQFGGSTANNQDKAYNYGVLDWNHLENWNSNRKRVMETSLSGNDSPPEIGSTRIPKSTINNSSGKQAEQTITSERETSLQNTRNYVSQHSSHDVTRNRHRAPKKLSQDHIVCDDDLCLNQHEDQLSESRKSFNHNLNGVNERRFYGCSFEDHFDSLTGAPSELENCMTFDPVIKGKHSSFSRRLSFSLEKMVKHFSFNSISDFQQLKSTYKSLKSGPVTLGLSPDLHNSNSRKENYTDLVKFIPMKRLLNSLLKHKGPHFPQKIHQSNRNLITSRIDEKRVSFNVEAILQLTMKNGIPLFILVADSNNRNILVAAVEKLPSGKDDSSLTYTFHSVNEIKKNNSGWKNQDSIEKGHCFDHDTVGHMKISSSYHAEFSGLERDLFVVRESVLYGPDCMPTGELAAIIVKNISKENYGGIGDSKSTVVILPGGSHSVPNSGQPSSLINRWKSGGVCDCGGWDIGCEFGVLTNQNESTEISSPSTSDRLDLYFQGRHNNKHDFSLVLLENGLYSLEYNASITLLQAFSICVAIVSSQNLTHMFQVNHVQDVNGFTKPVMTRHQKVKSQKSNHCTC